jgi:hypothetical protein
MSETNSAAPAAQQTEVTTNVASNPNTSTSQVGESDVQEILADENSGTEPKVQTEAKKEEIREMKKKLKLKVHGREMEKEIDFANEKELKQLLEKAYGADTTFQEASKIKKQMAAIAEMLHKDPFALMREAGLDPDDLTAKYMEERLKEMEKSPEQKQLEELQKQVEQERQRREALENEKMQAEQQRIQESYMRDMDDQITDALGSAELPKSPYVVKRIAEYLSIGLEQGKQLSVKDVVPLVQKSIKNEIREMFEAFPEDVIEGFLGDNVLNKMKKRRLAKMKEVQSASTVKSTGQTEIAKTQVKAQPKEKIPARDFWSKIGR